MPPSTERRWRRNDALANKNGRCQTVYWVAPVPPPRDTLTHTVKAADLIERKYKVSETYKGEWLNNKRDGFGVYVYSNGDKYSGEWKDGRRDGQGALWQKTAQTTKSLTTTPHRAVNDRLRCVYSGEWRHDVKSGSGKYFYVDGAVYDGEWSNDVRHGLGTFARSDGAHFIGHYMNDVNNGHGTEVLPNGDWYDGEWCNGLKEGRGVYYYHNKQRIYDGQWINGKAVSGALIGAFDWIKQEFAAAEKRLSDAATLLAQRLLDDGLSASMSIPRLRLNDADRIIAKLTDDIENVRAPIRSLPFTQPSELYDAQSMHSFRAMFDAECAANGGRMTRSHTRRLVQACLQFDAPTKSAEVEAVWEQLRLSGQRSVSPDVSKHESTTLSFDDLIVVCWMTEQNRLIVENQIAAAEADEPAFMPLPTDNEPETTDDNEDVTTLEETVY